MDKANNDLTAGHFETYRQNLLGFFRSRVSSPDYADDLLQQVFLRLVQRADWEQIENPEAYVRTTARHVLADFYRGRSARDNGVVLDFNDLKSEDETWSPDRSMGSEDFLRQLAAVLESLSPQVRKAFVLSRIYGYTYKEIGSILSISPRTVEKHVAKGLARCFEFALDSSDDENPTR